MRRVGLMLAVFVSACLLALPGTTPRADAAANDIVAVVIEGTGNGHGRGMSQWGAYGWAVDHGWNWVQILDHYYGGTSMGDVGTTDRIGVRLQALDGAGSVGLVSHGSGVTFNGGGLTQQSLRAVPIGGGAYAVYGSSAITCEANTWLGNWYGPLVFTAATGENSGSSALEATGVCQPNGSIVHYRGWMEVWNTAEGTRVVNNIKVEDYLRGVVPREISASWADAGAGAGANAVRAQAVAARSYALSQNRYSYARTCDTQSCQVYAGAATRPTATGAPVSVEDLRTDQAIAATAGKVRRGANGDIVSTEFSASNGPRTAGGAFPPVDDAPGDGTSRNPNHYWTRVIDADTLAAQYGLGAVTSATMVEAASASYRQYDGIWFNDVVLTGSNGVVKQMNAWDFRGAFGLPSPGFTVSVVTRGSVNSGMAYVGDSIGVGVAGTDASPFRMLTDGTFTSATFDSTENRCTNRVCGGKSSGVQVANSLPANLGLVIVELGYNDNPSLTAGDIDAMMSALNARGTQRVVWVNMAEIRRGPGGSSYYAASNAALNAATGRWGNLSIADWNQASATPERSRWFATDGVHLTTTGNAKFSTWLRSAATPSHRLAPPRQLEIPVVGEAVTTPNGAGAVVPSTASAVALNITAVGPAGPGYFTVWPCGTTRPVASNVNFLTGAVVANGVIAPVGTNGKVCVYSSAGSDVVVDIAGWFGGGAGSGAPGYVSAVPQRLVDTRDGTGGRLGPVVDGAPLSIAIAGRTATRPDGSVATIPAGVPAVAVNVTAVSPGVPGYLTVWPCGTTRPLASNVNYMPGQFVANGVVAPVGADGSICLHSSAPANVVVDVLGWFDPAANGQPAAFVGAIPKRFVDTRDGTGGRSGRVTSTTPISMPVRGAALDVGGVTQAVPADASAVALNVTIVQPSGPGFATVWPCGTPQPLASNVNFNAAGVFVPNNVTAPIGTDGSVCIHTSTDAHVVVDVSGWYSGSSPAGFTAAVPKRIVDTRDAVGPAPT